MKTKLAAGLAVLALVVTGCGATSGDLKTTSPSATATASGELGLTAWVSNVGLIEAITTVTTGLSSDLANLTSTDIAAAGKAFAARSKEVAAIATDIAGEPPTDSAAFDQLRTAMVDALKSYADSAAALGKATSANRQGMVLAATTTLSTLTGAIQALVDYIAAHGADKIHPAA